MMPCVIFKLPHNFRTPLYDTPPRYGDPDDDAAASEREPRVAYATLPIEMPRSVLAIYACMPFSGVPVAIVVPGVGRIRREDIATVWRGITQYNTDCGGGE